MKPKEIANRIMDTIGKADDLKPECRYPGIRATLLTLASELCALEPTFGHAERLHKLTGGEPPKLNNWSALELSAELATRFTSGTPGAVADELTEMGKCDALAVAVFLAASLKPSQRYLLVDLILGG